MACTGSVQWRQRCCEPWLVRIRWAATGQLLLPRRLSYPGSCSAAPLEAWWQGPAGISNGRCPGGPGVGAEGRSGEGEEGSRSSGDGAVFPPQPGLVRHLQELLFQLRVCHGLGGDAGPFPPAAGARQLWGHRCASPRGHQRAPPRGHCCASQHLAPLSPRFLAFASRSPSAFLTPPRDHQIFPP